jgi:hypothetical protein
VDSTPTQNSMKMGTTGNVDCSRLIIEHTHLNSFQLTVSNHSLMFLDAT